MSNARREASWRIGETCPSANNSYESTVEEVEKLLGGIEGVQDSDVQEVVSAIKTMHDFNTALREQLRDVLVSVCDDLLQERENVESLERDIDRLNEKIDDLTTDVKILEEQLSSLEVTE